MAWIELHQSLPGHKKTHQASRALGISRTQFIGHVVQFWLWAVDNAPDGKLSGIDAPIVEDESGWEGSPGTFWTALLAAGFIDADGENQFVIHDWYDYAGKLIEARRRDRERKKNSRGILAESARNSSGTIPIPVEIRRNDTNSGGMIPIPMDRARAGAAAPTQPNPTKTNQPGGLGGNAIAGEEGSGGSATEAVRILHDGIQTPITEIPGDRLAYLVNKGRSKRIRGLAAAELRRRDEETATARTRAAPAATDESPPDIPNPRTDPAGYQEYVRSIRRRKGWEEKSPEDHGFSGIGGLAAKAAGGEE